MTQPAGAGMPENESTPSVPNDQTGTEAASNAPSDNDVAHAHSAGASESLSVQQDTPGANRSVNQPQASGQPVQEGLAPRTATNESSSLQPGAAAAAARTHALCTRMITFAEAIQQDIEKWVPASVLAAGEAEVRQFARTIF